MEILMPTNVAAQYYPRGYIIEFGDSIDLNNLDSLSDSDFATLLHEFIHYYQDLASGFRINLLWMRNNLIRMVHHASASSISVKIPYEFKNGYRHQVEVYDLLNEASSCSDELKPIDCIDVTATIKNGVNFFLSDDNPCKGKNNYVEVKIGNGEYILSGYVLEECMAAMYECTVYPFNKGKYKKMVPYAIPFVLAKNNLAWENIPYSTVGLLCEYSLEFYNPGVIFLETLEYFKASGIKPDYEAICKRANDVMLEIHNTTDDNVCRCSYYDYIEKLVFDYVDSLYGISTFEKQSEYAFFLSSLSLNATVLKMKQMFPMYKFIVNLPTNQSNRKILKSFMALFYPIIRQKNQNGQYEIISLQPHDSPFDFSNSVWWYWFFIDQFWTYIRSSKKPCPFISICQNFIDCPADNVCKEKPYQKGKCDACLFWNISGVFNLAGKMI